MVLKRNDQKKIFQKVNSKKSICLLCKGGKLLCGKPYCPVLIKAQAMAKHSGAFNSTNIQGSTPPAIFVGRLGYPKVLVGPMIPSYFGDTEILDTPELWVGKSINDIIDYRYSLIRGKMIVDIHEPSKNVKTIDTLQELAMSNTSIESEAQFTKRPTGRIILSEYSQPFGPSAPLKSFLTSNINVDRRIEKAFYDRDLKASEAIQKLYGDGVLVTRIQRALSIGLLGLGARRKLVPTRWSITAVDSALSLSLINKIKDFDTIDDYSIYYFENLGNIFIAIFLPRIWSFEWIEAWFPGTVWNVGGSYASLMGDFEGHKGRSAYARVGGCYYSARLAVAEKLGLLRKQATAIVFREIHPEYMLPVGVWNVRESMRKALETKPLHFNTLEESLNYVENKLTIPIKKWIKNSSLLKDALYQKRITDFKISYDTYQNFN